MSQKAERPDVINSETQRVQTGYGKVYIIVGYDENDDPYEVFINTGDSGGYTNAWCEALGKTLSNALQFGAEPDELADDLMGIATDRVKEDNGDTILSIPDAVGVALKRSIEGKQAEPIRE